MIEVFLAAICVLLAGGALAFVLAGRPRWAHILGAGFAVVGCALGLVPVFACLLGGGTCTLRLPWDVPMGSFFVTLDALSAVFALPILLLSGLSAVYGVPYLSHRGAGILPASSAGVSPAQTSEEAGAVAAAFAATSGDMLPQTKTTRKHGTQDATHSARSWFHFNLLVASMLMVVVARNAVLFLLAWEMMSLASFFLVMLDDRRDSVRQAGWTYLVATHIGTAFLLVLFLLMGRESGSLDFDKFSDFAAAPALASAAFLLAVVGFGTKAGFMPLHVWLPEAHPAAPSHVSAVLSGVMIKTGIYGIVRTLTMLGTPPAWWGWLLVGVGVSSGILGVLYALAQHDLKRLLAYHSVENIGIIALGLGLGVVGQAYRMPMLATAGYAGAILHVTNHAIFKGLLFLGAGAVIHATGTGEMDVLGGLIKKMPRTALAFLAGAAAISGLPPLNGFVSEFLIYVGAFRGAATGPAAVLVGSMAILAALALIGGLAAACFAKAFGIVFLGEPRSEQAKHAHEAPPAMRGPMLALAALCLLIGLTGPLALRTYAPAVQQIVGDSKAVSAAMLGLAWPMLFVSIVATVFIALVIGLVYLRRRLLAGRGIESSGTWDCGYIAPTARMQYTASSFAQPITRMFTRILGERRKVHPPQGLFPAGADFHSHSPDRFLHQVFAPLLGLIAYLAGRLRWMQHGRLQLYVLYIALTLVVLMVWKLS